jgi:hypothetical protein
MLAPIFFFAPTLHSPTNGMVQLTFGSCDRQGNLNTGQSMRHRKFAGIVGVMFASWLGLNHLIGGSGAEPTNVNFEMPASEQPAAPTQAGQLLAGVAKVEITNKKAFPINDPLYAKALVLKNGSTTAVIVTIDAVAIGNIGHIGNDYLGKVRARIQKALGITPDNVMVNASHCHANICADVDDKT